MTALSRVLVALVSVVAFGAAAQVANAPAGPAPVPPPPQIAPLPQAAPAAQAAPAPQAPPAAPSPAASAAAPTLNAIPVAKDGTVSVKVDVPGADEKREPVVQRTVIDDGRAMIEELRVRGQLVKVTVHPKDGAPSYEIIVGDSSRELSTEGRNNSRGATGKRVWQVFSF